MPNTNQFLPFGLDPTANVLTNSAWAALAQRATGFVSGRAASNAFNKALRQSSAIATMIAQFIADRGPSNVNDDGNLAALQTAFEAAIITWAANGNPVTARGRVAGNGTAITGQNNLSISSHPGTGTLVMAFGAPQAGTNYQVLATSEDPSVSCIHRVYNKSVNGFTIGSILGNGVGQDPAQVNVVVFGTGA